MKQVWLCLDPGLVTGWALLDNDGRVLGTSVWGTAELRDSLDKVIRSAHLAGCTIVVVIERMPGVGGQGTLARKLEAVRRDIMLVVQETYELQTVMVAPGEWKPSRVARTTKIPALWEGEPLVIHQKDAVRMGRYAIAKQAG